MRALLALVGVVASVLPGARRLSAQSGTELGLSVGLYSPMSSFEGRMGPVVPGSNNYKHQAALALGIDVGFWSKEDPLGFTVQFGMSSSDVRQEAISGDTSLPASVWWIGAALAYKVVPRNEKNDVRFRAGLGYLHHGGSAFEPYGSKGSLTGLLGLEATMPLRPGLLVFGGADGHLYSLQLTEPGASYESRFQTDIIARIGVRWSSVERKAEPN